MIPLLRTMPASGTHSRRPSASLLGLNFVGRAWKALRTQSAIASGWGGDMGRNVEEKLRAEVEVKHVEFTASRHRVARRPLHERPVTVTKAL